MTWECYLALTVHDRFFIAEALAELNDEAGGVPVNVLKRL